MVSILHILIFASFITCQAADKPFKILLYGEEVKGFLEMREVSDGEYSLHFDLKDDQDTKDLRWSIHTSSAPYDVAVITENCKRCKKSPQILRDQKVKDVTLDESQIVGHTLVLEKGDKVLACATVIVPEYPLYQASFHQQPIHGHIHIIKMGHMVRVLPDLRYNIDYEASDPRAEVLDWAFVQDCQGNNIEQSGEGTELGVDSRTTLTLETIGANMTLRNFALFRGGKPFACSRLEDVEPRSIEAGNEFKFTQEHIYSATRWTGKSGVPPPGEVHVRDDCMDVSTETLHRPLPHSSFFPSISIFGPDTIILKSLVPLPSTDPQKCLVLRPHFARPIARATFAHPIVGDLVLMDSDDVILVSGRLRHLFDETPTRATIQVSPRFTDPGGCPKYGPACGDCATLRDSALVAGRNDPEDLNLAGVLPYFNLSMMNSVIVDLTWTKVCANLTQLPSGAIQARANIRRYSPVSAPVVATVVLMEYPANNYTEVVINKRVQIEGISFHERPVDMAVTEGPPCGELTIGPMKEIDGWMKRLNQSMINSDNDTTLIVDERLITGPRSALSQSLLLNDVDQKNVYCGDFSLATEPASVLVAIFNDSVKGFVKLEQSPDSSGSYPTIVSYLLEAANDTRPFGIKEEPIEWSLVEERNMTCPSALLFNPTQANETDCSFDSPKNRCPFGRRAEKLEPNRRISIPVSDLPLHGPFAINDESVRLELKDGQICSQLVQMKRASLRWKVLSKRSLSELQESLSKRWNLQTFQIQIGYNRELVGGWCSIYRITFLTTEEQLSAIFDAFSSDSNRFNDEDEPICDRKDQEKEETTTIDLGPKKTSSSLNSCLIFAFFLVFLRLIF